MTTKFKTTASDNDPALVFPRVIEHDPAAVAPTFTKYAAAVAPDFIETRTTSFAAIVELVSVKATSTPAAREALFNVMLPQVLFRVTPVDLFVDCVTVPPAPVPYPIPAVPVETIVPVAVNEVPVAAPITGVVKEVLAGSVTVPVKVGEVNIVALLSLVTLFKERAVFNAEGEYHVKDSVPVAPNT